MSVFLDEAGVLGVCRAERSVRLWRGVSGNKIDDFVGDFEAKERTGHGTAKSRSTFLVGDLEGDPLGDEGGPANEKDDMDALGER